METEELALDYVELTLNRRDFMCLSEDEFDEFVASEARMAGLRDGPIETRFDNAYFVDTGNFNPNAIRAYVWAV